MTILLVSHDLGFVSNIVQSVVCVNRRVVHHPTSVLTGEIIQEIYGDANLLMVRHDHICSAQGHRHE
jgi:zinc transport system ATP-binding protein